MTALAISAPGGPHDQRCGGLLLAGYNRWIRIRYLAGACAGADVRTSHRRAARSTLMFAAVIASAWLATGWCRVPPDIGARVTIDGLALALVLLGELAIGPFVRGNVGRWFAS